MRGNDHAAAVSTRRNPANRVGDAALRRSARLPSRKGQVEIQPGRFKHSPEIIERAGRQLPLAHVMVDLDRHVQAIGKWLHGLNGPGVRTGDNCRDVLPGEQIGDPLGLYMALVGQTAHLVGAVFRMRVANEKEPAGQLFNPLDSHFGLH